MSLYCFWHACTQFDLSVIIPLQLPCLVHVTGSSDTIYTKSITFYLFLSFIVNLKSLGCFLFLKYCSRLWCIAVFLWECRRYCCKSNVGELLQVTGVGKEGTGSDGSGQQPVSECRKPHSSDNTISCEAW